MRYKHVTNATGNAIIQKKLQSTVSDKSSMRQRIWHLRVTVIVGTGEVLKVHAEISLYTCLVEYLISGR